MSNDQNKSGQNKDQVKAGDQKGSMNPTAPKVADPVQGEDSKNAPKSDVVGGEPKKV